MHSVRRRTRRTFRSPRCCGRRFQKTRSAGSNTTVHGSISARRSGCGNWTQCFCRSAPARDSFVGACVQETGMERHFSVARKNQCDIVGGSQKPLTPTYACYSLSKSLLDFHGGIKHAFEVTSKESLPASRPAGGRIVFRNAGQFHSS